MTLQASPTIRVSVFARRAPLTVDQITALAGYPVLAAQVLEMQSAINALNEAAGFPDLGTGPIPNWQIREALRAGGHLQDVIDAVPADQTDPVAVRWLGNASVKPGDVLATFIATVIGMDAAGMTALFAAARAVS